MMNPYMSWAILLTIVGGLGWYYTGGFNNKGKTTASKVIIEKGETALGSKKPKRKIKKSPDASGHSTPAAKIEEESPNTPTPTVVADSKVNDDVDNKEFAMRLSKVKTGTPIVSATKNGPSKKERRAQKVTPGQPESGSNEVPESHISTRSSSTAGADADDDLSPITSPLMAPATGDVSDMLEKPGAGPSVLRLTGAVQGEQKKQKQQSFKPVETKKQRQQKAKNESKRLQVEEAEKQRRILLEKQLHTTREAERRETAQTKPSAPVNAWAASNDTENTNGASKPAANPSSTLLDTFTPVSSNKKMNGKAAKTPQLQPNTQQQSPAAQASQISAGTTKANSKNWADELPSEEEQMRILGAMSSENEWTTVPSRKKEKKGTKADGGDGDDASVS